MRPICIHFQYDEVRMTFWHKPNLDFLKPLRFIISSHGMPSHPYQHSPAKMEYIIENNFIMIFPNYIGTWESDGTMSWENCVKTILKTIEFIKLNEHEDIFGSSHSWRKDEISLLGGSFGAAIALVTSAKSDEIKKIIAVSTPTNWRNHSKIPEESTELIDNLYYQLRKGWKHSWRIPNKKEWNRIVDGSADINPVDYVKELKLKDTLLIHGSKDLIVSVNRSKKLHEEISGGSGLHELICIENAGHLGNDAIGRDDVKERVLAFLLPIGFNTPGACTEKDTNL